MTGETKYLFGPVASRRLGRSLGVDIVPLKTCSQNCLYCQLGLNTEQTLERRVYIPIEAVLSELKERVTAGLNADYITLSGSGEPTLNSQIGELIDGIKQITDIPVAIITNGTLLGDGAVRADCAKADVVLPSLDAGDEETFKKINCPHRDINFAAFVEGLCRFRSEYTGQIWLEVFFLERVNTEPQQVERIKAIIELVGSDKVQLNTAVRPGTDESVVRVDSDRLEELAKQLGPKAEVIADFSKPGDMADVEIGDETILEMLRRRSCSVDDICSGLGVNTDAALKCLTRLENDGVIISEQNGEKKFFKLK